MRTRLPVRLLELFLSRKAGARAISRMFRHIRPIETAIYGTDFAIHGMSPHKKTPLFLPYSGKKRYFRPKRYATSDVGVSLSAVRVFAHSRAVKRTPENIAFSVLKTAAERLCAPLRTYEYHPAASFF